VYSKDAYPTIFHRRGKANRRALHSLVFIPRQTWAKGEKKNYLFSLIDMALRDFKTQSSYSS